MQLALSSWPEIQAYLDTQQGVIVPIGSTEQHGPNGLLGTDAICPTVIAERVGAQLQTLVAPTIAFGNAQHHLAFSGTMALRPSTLLAVVKDLVQCLAHHGFKKVYFLNGHGGNIATVTAAFSEVYAAVSLEGTTAVQCRLRNWYEGERVRTLGREFYADAEGSHGTASEVSVTQYAHPEHIKVVTFKGKANASNGIFDAQDYRQRYPDGRIGSDPSLSSPTHGEQLVQAAVEDVVEDYQRFLASP